jgi:hypothetical protein
MRPKKASNLTLEHTKIEHCKAGASAFEQSRLQNLRSSGWLLLLMDLGTIATGWLIAWLIAFVGRWIYRGSVSA